MRRDEITKKFDEIVTFAELEKFIDTAVKHYSSGMYVRLAFAVAAHLEPEILLVDEVLAVGDIRFQKKCLGKMGDVAREGRTVIFVSHQLNQIRRLCERAVWLENGSVSLDGPMQNVLAAYESAMARGDKNEEGAKRRLDERGRFTTWKITSQNDSHTLATLGKVTIKFGLKLNRLIEMGHHGIALFNSEGQLIWGYSRDNMRLEPGMYELTYSFEYLPVRPGVYTWKVSLYDGGEAVDAWDCLPQMVVATEPLGHPRDEWAGSLNLPISMQVSATSQNQ
jgi:lipopolysaccharide transport system ATP-binding protein